MPRAVRVKESRAVGAVLNDRPGRESDSSGRMVMMALAVITALGFFVRVVLSWNSLGSNDWETWRRFATLVSEHGLFKPYSMDGDLNHPPLPVIWSWMALGLAHLTRTSFPFIFRLAPIATDAGCAVLLWRIWTRRRDLRWGWLAAAAMAWNLDAILDGAYHCNTDNLCAFFTLLAAYELVERRNFLLGGLALAGAINVKIVPVVLIPAFLSLCPDWTQARRFIIGMAIGAIPFAVVLCVTPGAFIRNVLAYNSQPSEWGLMIFPTYGAYIPLFSQAATHAVGLMHTYGKYPLLAIALGLGVVSWRLRRWDAYQIGALGWCVFLIFTPGWGLQYTVYVVPLLLASDLGRGMAYGLVAGLYLLTRYAMLWYDLPLQSIFSPTSPSNPLSELLAILAWGILVGYFIVTLWRGFFQKPMAA